MEHVFALKANLTMLENVETNNAAMVIVQVMKIL
jgi:hypothetical protein